MAVEQKAVDAACDQILARNEKVTQRSVRQITGGSYTTIGLMIENWKMRKVEADELSAIVVPEAIGARMSEAVAAIWRAATEAATEGHEAMREAIVEAKAEKVSLQCEMSDIVTELEARITKVEAERDQAQKNANKLDVAIIRIEEQLKAAQAETKRADEARIDADVRANLAQERLNAMTQRESTRNTES